MKRFLITLLMFSLFAGGLFAQSGGEKDAWKLFRGRDYKTALERFGKEANLYPEWEVVHDAMGWCHYFLGDYQAAEAKFQEALEKNGSYEWSLQGLEAIAATRAAPLEAAQALLAAGRYAEARAAFQRIHEGLTAAPAEDFAGALAGEGWCLYSLVRYRDAKNLFRRSLKIERGDSDNYFGIAYCEYALGDYRNALASLELGFKGDPGNYRARLFAGWCHYWRGRYARAEDAFEAAQRLADADWEAWDGRGWSRFRLGDRDAALEDFLEAVDLSPYAFGKDLRALVEADPEWRVLYSRTGWSALRAHLDTWAEQEFQTAVGLDSADVQARCGLAFSGFRLGQYERAMAIIQDLAGVKGAEGPWSFPVILSDGSTHSIPMNLASLECWAQYRVGLYGPALSGFQAVRTAHPDWVDPACGEAWIRFSQGDYSAAQKIFAAAERLLPGYSDAVSGTAAVLSWRFAEYNGAWTVLLGGAPEEAAAAFREILKESGFRFPRERKDLLHASLGWALMRAGDADGAEESYRQALDVAPDSPLAHRGWGLLLMEAGRWDRAVDHLRQALEDEAAAVDAEQHVDLGWCLLRSGSDAEALESFVAALQLDPNSASALAGKGDCHLRLGELVAGRLAWERAIALAPDLADRGDLRQQMESEPELQKLHSSLGWAWYYRSDLDRAEREFRLARERDPLERSVLRGLGLLLLRNGGVGEGSKLIEEYLRNMPDVEDPWGTWSSTLSELGWGLYSAGEHRKALEVFRRLGKLHGGGKLQYADPFDGAGWCLLGMGKERDAKKEFLKAIGISPRYENSLLGLEAIAELN